MWERKMGGRRLGRGVIGGALIGSGLLQLACSAGSEEALGSSEQALLGGENFNAKADPEIASARACDGDEKVGIQNAALAGRWMASSRAFEQCLSHNMLKGGIIGSNAAGKGPYSCSLDPASLPKSIDALVERANRQTPINVACFSDSSGNSGLSRSNSQDDQIWVKDERPQEIFDGLALGGAEGFYGPRRREPIEAMRFLAGTIWHEMFHTLGYQHSKVWNDAACSWDHSIPYIVDRCMAAIWDSSLESCADTACLGPATFPILSAENPDEYAALVGHDPITQGSRCECVRDPGVAAAGVEYAPSARFGPTDLNQHFGASIVTGNFNGDLFQDIAVGIPGDITTAGKTGSVVVYLGSAFGPLPAQKLAFATTPLAQFGAALAADDFDGDGFTDLAVGAPGAASGAGVVYVARGGETKLSSVPAWLVTGKNTEHLGSALGAGRLAPGGFGDSFLVAGAPSATVNGQANAGKAYIYRGSETTGGPPGSILGFESELFAPSMPAENGHFGASVGFTGLYEQREILTIGAPGQREAFLYHARNYSDFTQAPPASKTLSLEDAPEDFGALLVAGTFTNSIIPSVAVASPSGTIAIYELDGDLVQTLTRAPIRSLAAGNVFVPADATAGFQDLLVGASDGVAFFSGAFGGVDETERGLIDRQGGDDNDFGSQLALADVEYDFVDDLIIGAPNETADKLGAGAAYVLNGKGDIKERAFKLWKILDEAEIVPGGATGTAPPSFDLDDQSWKAESGGTPFIRDASRRSQGAASIRVTSTGFVLLRSPLFRTTELKVLGDKLKLDVWLPPITPAPPWSGAIAMLASIPGANINNAFIGQVELTGLPRGKWTSIELTLPSAVRQALEGAFDGASFAVTVNAPQGDKIWLDGLRFSGDLHAHSPEPQPVSSSTAGIFGFENVGDWYSPQLALQTATQPVAQGSRSLQLVPAGWTEISSRLFATPVAGNPQTLTIKARLPDVLPNPWWSGDLSAQLSCPEAAIYNAYLGNVSLQGATAGAFSSFDIPLDAGARAALGAIGHCRVSLFLNVAGGQSAYYLDALELH